MKKQQKNKEAVVQNSTHKKAAMIAALEKTLGIVTSAAKIVGIERSTHYFWMESDEAYRKAVKDLDNVVLDFVESKLHKLVEDLNPTAVIFTLKTKGKQRGYIEQNDVNVTGLEELLKKLSNIEIE
jgi:hypothetical protein